MDDAINGRAEARQVPAGLKKEIRQFLEANDGEEESTVNREPYEAVAGYIQELLATQGDGHRPIDTWSGEKVTPLDPDPENITIVDIAHGLANLGRFAGQGPSMYSVARHSVHVSLEVEARGGSLEAQRWGLVHDGAEAYLSDVPGPVKKGLPGYKHAERRLDRAIRTALCIELNSEEEEIVHDIADTEVGKQELAEQFPEGGYAAAELEHDPDTVDDSRDDEELFRHRAYALRLGNG